MKNTRLQMFADWFKEGQHPEEHLLGIPMSIKKEYSEYYKEKTNNFINDVRLLSFKIFDYYH